MRTYMLKPKMKDSHHTNLQSLCTLDTNFTWSSLWGKQTSVISIVFTVLSLPAVFFLLHEVSLYNYDMWLVMLVFSLEQVWILMTGGERISKG